LGIGRVGRKRLLELFECVAFLALDERVEEAAEVREMVIDHRARNAGGACYGLDRDAAVAELEDYAQRGIQKLLAPLLRRETRRGAEKGRARCIGRSFSRARHRARG